MCFALLISSVVWFTPASCNLTHKTITNNNTDANNIQEKKSFGISIEKFRYWNHIVTDKIKVQLELLSIQLKIS